jgi:hypothetical protein
MPKKVGKHSAQANDFLEPKPIINLTVTDVGTNRAWNDGAANLSWALPSGSPEATLYTITTSPTTSTQTTSSTSYTFTGIPAGTYTFTVVASNNAGSSAGTTSLSTPITTVPNVPTSVSVSSPNPDQDVVSWSAPSGDGGKSVSSYKIISSDTATNPNPFTGVTSPYTINEVGGTTQSYTVYAYNSNGWSAGASTGNITTTPPFFPPFFPPYFPPFFPPYFPPFFPPFFPPYFPPFFPPYFPPFFPPFFPPYFPPFFPPYFPPFFPPYFVPPFFPPYFPPFFPPYFVPPTFKAPYFVPPSFCVEAETVINTKDGWKAAKEIKVGDVLITAKVDGTSTDKAEVEVTNITITDTNNLIYFNGEENLKMTSTENLWLEKDGEYLPVLASEVKVGDKLLGLNRDSGQFETIEIKSIEISEGEYKVYNFAPAGILITNSIVVDHTK